jgi:hypothetical protein
VVVAQPALLATATQHCRLHRLRVVASSLPQLGEFSRAAAASWPVRYPEHSCCVLAADSPPKLCGRGDERKMPAPAQQAPSSFLAALCSAAPGAGAADSRTPSQGRQQQHAPRHKVRGMTLPPKYAALASMFDAIVRVATLRLRRGQAMLFAAVSAAAGGICHSTITPKHVQQMQAVAGDLIQFVNKGATSTIELPVALDQHRSAKMREKKWSQAFRDQLLLRTRDAYQKFLDSLPANSRPAHTARDAKAWHKRFSLDNDVPDIELPISEDRHPASSKRALTAGAEGSGTSGAKRAAKRPRSEVAVPTSFQFTTGDAVEVVYGGVWYPAEVCAVERGPRPRASAPPPPNFLPFARSPLPLSDCELHAVPYLAHCLRAVRRVFQGTRSMCVAGTRWRTGGSRRKPAGCDGRERPLVQRGCRVFPSHRSCWR